MKKILLSIITLFSLLSTRADEGMWIPSLIGKNYDEMVRLGLQLSKDDLYNINNSSLKDAIVQFGGGCTAEMISGNGLLITNHHCGYDAIAGLSSVEKNYLDNGFWAYSMTEELPASGLSVIFLQRIEDVTKEVSEAIANLKGEKLNQKLEETRKKIETRFEENGKFVANLKEYFNGNQYLLLIYKKYTDVRLVGTPPKSLGKYGGDTDNWMWPRHTADFSMFRVYANAENEPAPYNAANQPYKPKKYLPVSIHGVEEGDYAMIYGYPGRTNRYDVSYGVDVAIKEVNPSIVSIREKRLAIMQKNMDADKSVYLKLTSSKQKISNYWKYFIGQTAQLERLNVVEIKKQQEKVFTKWAKKNEPDYALLMTDYAKAYATYRPYAKHATYYTEAFKAAALSRMAAAIEPLYKAYEKGNTSKDTLDKYVNALKASRKSLMKEYDPGTDEDVFAAMTQMYYNEVPKTQHPDVYQHIIFNRFGGGDMDKTYTDYAAFVYANSFFCDSNRFNNFTANPSLEAIESDPAAQYAISFVRNYETYYQPKITAFNNTKKALSKKYLRGWMEMKPEQNFYPDANSTMRISYGKVAGYNPQDAVKFDYYTTIDGLMTKYKPGDDEFDLPKDLVSLYKKKDYGKYMSADSTIHTCFITNNDITGGNSGSPVINGNGELIGLAFDGNWEAMSGDIAFDKKYKRTICVDARFVMFIIEKLGKAYNLIEEIDARQ